MTKISTRLRKMFFVELLAIVGMDYWVDIHTHTILIYIFEISQKFATSQTKRRKKTNQPRSELRFDGRNSAGPRDSSVGRASSPSSIRRWDPTFVFFAPRKYGRSRKNGSFYHLELGFFLLRWLLNNEKIL